METLSSLFWFFALFAGAGTWLFVRSYNRLQSLSQTVKEQWSNVQVAITYKLNLINQLIDLVKNHQQGEQLTYLTISKDNTNQGVVAAYAQSDALLMSLKGIAQTYPELKSGEQYSRLMTSIESAEGGVQSGRKVFNACVKSYNDVCLAIPTVFFSGAVGFSPASYLEFDAAGNADVAVMKEFRTDDGEHLKQLISGGANRIAEVAKVLATQTAQATKELSGYAGQTGKMLSEKYVASVGAPPTRYFYLIPGGVPQGPATLAEIQQMVASGMLDASVGIAEVGGQHWRPLAVDTLDAHPSVALPPQETPGN